MKTAIKFLAFLLIVIIGCGRGKNDGSKVNNKANVVEKPVHNSMDVSEIAEDNFTDDDPFSELIVQYSPQQLQQILGKKEPQDVIDLFLLLPESDFLRYFNFTVEQRKKMIQGHQVQSDFGEIGLNEIDLSNNYISSGYEGVWEMFAKKIDGIWSIALNEQNCGASCVTVLEKWYAYDNGKLFSQRYANLAGYQDLWPELFIDFGQLTETQKQEAMAIWERDIRSGENEEDAILFSNVLFRLPRDGKIITMYIDKEPYTEVGIPESAFKVVSKEIWE